MTAEVASGSIDTEALRAADTFTSLPTEEPYRFDLDQNGTATPQDAEQVKRIVTNFGGNVVDKINVDTDFVVLGKEPAIPEKPTEPDPLLQREYEEAMAAYEAYGRISDEARAYRIPILNQNRFLYLTGHYESAKR